jgi:DDE superfamily endonuclease
MVTEFEHLRNKSFPGVIGAVDGCQIPIKQPTQDKSSYYNRNKFYSVTLQGICDNKKLFIDVYSGWPGAAHDSRVWTHSPIHEYLTRHCDTDLHVIGDSAYPLTNFCMVRYKNNGHLSEAQRYYNKVHSSSRVIIEQAFGLLKCRFRRLKMLDMSLMDYISKVITVACVLHNICIINNDLLQYTREITADEDEDDDINNNNNNGNDKRERIKNVLWANRND